MSQLFLTRPLPLPTTVHFKVSGQGITLTDNARKLFFRKHHPVSAISHCGVDPEDRRWSCRTADGAAGSPNKLFAFVARKAGGRPCNQVHAPPSPPLPLLLLLLHLLPQCHIFAELDPEQPARAIVNFVNKLMMSGSGGAGGRGGDMV